MQHLIQIIINYLDYTQLESLFKIHNIPLITKFEYNNHNAKHTHKFSDFMYICTTFPNVKIIGLKCDLELLWKLQNKTLLSKLKFLQLSNKLCTHSMVSLSQLKSLKFLILGNITLHDAVPYHKYHYVDIGDYVPAITKTHLFKRLIVSSYLIPQIKKNALLFHPCIGMTPNLFLKYISKDHISSKYIRIEYCHINHISLEILELFSNLRELVLYGCIISTHSIFAFPKLKYLSLINCDHKLSPQSINITHSPNLKYVKLIQSDMTIIKHSHHAKIIKQNSMCTKVETTKYISEALSLPQPQM